MYWHLVLKNLTVQSVLTASHQNRNHSQENTTRSNLVYNNMDNESFDSSANKVERCPNGLPKCMQGGGLSCCKETSEVDDESH